MRRRIALLAAVLLVSFSVFAQDDNATPVAGSQLANDTMAVRGILDAIGKSTVSTESVVKTAGGRVIVLDLTNNPLDGAGFKTLPAQVGELTGLQQLLFSGNVVTTLPQELAKLSQLQVLDAANNEIVNVPAWIGDLQSLRKLNFKNNEFSDLPPALFTLKNLWHLHLHGNDLVTLSEDVGKLKNLKELYLERNRLTMLPVAITKLPKLEYFDYGYNKLCNLGPKVDAWMKVKDKKYLQLQKCW